MVGRPPKMVVVLRSQSSAYLRPLGVGPRSVDITEAHEGRRDRRRMHRAA